MRLLGGSVKRSLAMACLGRSITIAKAFGLDAATRIECHFFVVHPGSAGRLGAVAIRWRI